MTIILRAIIVIIFSTTIISCGKRGDLLPPEGYQPPQEEKQQ